MTRLDERTCTVKSGDVEIFCRVFGAPGATPILIVHGLSYFSYDWRELAASLARDRQIVVMDMRGFGDSGWSESKDYSLPTLAQDAVTVAAYMGWPRWIAMGHSMGGRVSTYYTAHHPERVEKLILVDYAPDQGKDGGARITRSVANQPDVFESVEAAMEYFGIESNSARALAMRPRYEAYLRAVPGGMQIKRDLHFRDQFKRVLETGERPKLGVDMWALLASVPCETLVVRGQQSDMFTADTVPKMLACNPRIELREVPTGHNVPGEDPAGLLACINEFLREKHASGNGMKPLSIRGIDHLALVTDNLPATLDFYTRILGLQLVHVRRIPYEKDRGQPPYDNLRHYFFNMGNDSLLAFFEYPKGLQKQNRDLIGGMQHLAFSVAPDVFEGFIKHIRLSGVEVIGPVPLGGRFLSAYLYDNNGIRLELCTTTDPENLQIVTSVLQSEEDARAELETLFSRREDVDAWLARMPLKQ